MASILSDFWVGMGVGFALGSIFMFCLTIWLYSGDDEYEPKGV